MRKKLQQKKYRTQSYLIEGWHLLEEALAAGAVVEQVFVVPGLGRLLISSISNRDYPVALCIVVIIAFVVVFMNYLADVITQYIDPRVRLS